MSTDAIFTFDEITWDAAQRRGMCFPTDRVALALAADPRVERLLICNQPRSAPVKLVKDALRRPAPFPASERVHLYEPLRLRRRDPSRSPALERSYAAYGRRLRRAAARHGLDRPAVSPPTPSSPPSRELELGRAGHPARHRRLGRPPGLRALAPRLPGRLRADRHAAACGSAP